MAQYKIPFNKAFFAGKELDYISEAINNGIISGDGPFTRKCHKFIEEELCSKKVFLTTSCTHALEMAAILLDIKEGDEVIVPSFTFVSSVNAFVLRGAKPVFVDIRGDTLNMDENKTEELITERTKAIVPVHYAGVGCEMDIITKIAGRHDIAVVEDNAHGFLGKYKGKALGTFGCMATLSFHETKNFSCGEGGAIVINDDKYIKRAEIIREKGTNRSEVFRGEATKYTWMDIGSSYLPSDMLAGFLYAQFEAKQEIMLKRKKVWEKYYFSLQDWATENNVCLPITVDYCEHPYHMFYFLMPSAEARDAALKELQTEGIHAVFHYLPLHLSKMGLKAGARKYNCPITVEISERIIRLPFYTGLTSEDQGYIIEKVQNIKV
jgi:dTDP-4-amino-4,6-dideoxygalactose transaminase